MGDLTLERLRRLRDRVTALSKEVINDLRPFAKDDGTFRRLPTSRSAPNDINVTTTCSCLMALALTDSFQNFYKTDTLEKTFEKATALLQLIVGAPWMSSGLADNNAFTTSLVLRAYGFLLSENCVGPATQPISRLWELLLPISQPIGFAIHLRDHSDPASQFLWLSLSDQTRDQISRLDAGSEIVPEGLERNLARDLRRIIETGWIYGESRFDKASADTKAALATEPTAYQLVGVNRRLLSDQYAGHVPPLATCNIDQIADLQSRSAENFAINSYPPSAAVIYWFVDGVARAHISVDKKNVQELCTWAAAEFNRKRSLVVSDHEAMMDPISLGMAASLCARLKRWLNQTEDREHALSQSLLPSTIELDHAVIEVIKEQTTTGIWHKYFPFFHYQDAGSNFCFAFEFLEALLCEFGRTPSGLLDNDRFIDALEKAVGWCEKNRYPSYLEDKVRYSGWNSGGQLQTLEKGQPESWATAVVHMFLSELRVVLAERIQEKILKKYNAKAPTVKENGKEEPKIAVKEMLDIRISMPGAENVLLSDILTERIVKPHLGLTPALLRRKASEGPLSALFFGPPGTSKTRITKAVASDLSWPLVEITPSHFVKGSLEKVYVQANEIFEDLMDLAGVVVFFDEMDALVQTRADGHLDMASQFLTTMMLPKLTELHDQGEVVFFMATNFQERFDPAIKRAGRFDLLLCMGPPSTEEKLKKLDFFFDGKCDDNELSLAKQHIEEYIKDSQSAQDQLELLTFGEFKSFLKRIGGKDDIGTKIKAKTKKVFLEDLKSYCNYATLRMKDLDALASALSRSHFESLSEAYTVEFSLKDLTEKQITNIVRYIADRRESKDQH